jgi:rubredoxin
LSGGPSGVGDADNGIAPGTSFESLPADRLSPECALAKDFFAALD